MPVKPKGILCILSQNVYTLSINDNFLDWEAAAQALVEYYMDIVSFQETSIH